LLAVATIAMIPMVVLFVAFSRLIRHAPHEADTPDDAQMADAERILESQTSTLPFLVHLRDKGLLFGADRRAMIMYGVKGRTWVALGDPVGPPESMGRLVGTFLERCEDFGAVPVFYEVSKEHLSAYADYGLTFIKLGEEARLDLGRFTLETGPAAKRHRQAMKRVEREGASYRLVPAPDVPAIIDDLRRVSDDWLENKHAAEKGFSLGFFDPDYVRHFPAGVLERDGRIVAFVTIWPGAQRFSDSY
jgi:phosphatidylglycerol lysyltransferase